MNKDTLVNKLGRIDDTIWNEAPRVQAQEWEDFSENILDSHSCWDELDIDELYEAVERGQFIISTFK